MQRLVRGSIVQQMRVGQREERPSQRSEYRKLIVGPLDCRKRVSDGLDFFPRVETASADEQMRKPSGFKRAHIRPSHIFGEAAESPEQQAHMTRLDRN